MKKSYQKLLLVGLVSSIGFMSSCEKDYWVPEPPQTGPVVPISYSNDMQPYFDASCAGCHNGTGIPLDLTPGNSYDAIINGGYVNTSSPSSSLLYTKIAIGGSMENIQLLKKQV